MDVIGFVRVSLGSSTDQLHDSHGSRQTVSQPDDNPDSVAFLRFVGTI
jgi:hypothetical protein